MYADYESLVNGAFDDTKAYFDGYINDNVYNDDSEKCGEFYYKGKSMLT
jgi:hypothetical protein